MDLAHLVRRGRDHVLAADERPLIGHELFRGPGAGDERAGRILERVVHNARAQLHGQDVVHLVLPVFHDAAAEHRDALDVVRLSAPAQFVELAVKLAVERVRHQGAHGLPVLVLPAALHLHIVVCDLLQERLHGEVWVLGAQHDGIDGRARDGPAAFRLAGPLLLLPHKADHHDDDRDDDDQPRPDAVRLFLVVHKDHDRVEAAAAGAAAPVIGAAPAVTASPVIRSARKKACVGVSDGGQTQDRQEDDQDRKAAYSPSLHRYLLPYGQYFTLFFDVWQ